ncbi:hypothetical protein GCM10010305_46430 [Streptomyces termitum]|uniref:Uncharacterized protein n=1 Tax=Streptomyces termitum TaxID=67368 RepID=A0A918WBP4_9ACTN|nr:hypothetical protein GCM10010305_46430 [Streptomyces termitum]
MSATAPRTSRARREAVSIAAWWAVLTLALRLLGHATGHPAGLAPSAAAAALFTAIGETGDWARRRWKARRHGRPKHVQASPSRSGDICEPKYRVIPKPCSAGSVPAIRS